MCHHVGEEKEWNTVVGVIMMFLIGRLMWKLAKAQVTTSHVKVHEHKVKKIHIYFFFFHLTLLIWKMTSCILVSIVPSYWNKVLIDGFIISIYLENILWENYLPQNEPRWMDLFSYKIKQQTQNRYLLLDALKVCFLVICS